MARPIRGNFSKRQSLSTNAQAWLRGEPCRFIKFEHQDELEAQRTEYGDRDNF
jgi:hypothetical protein